MSGSDRISITGHYTGSVWYYNKMSIDALVTPVGKVMYHAMQPMNRISRRLFGLDMDGHLLQRHHVMDHLIANHVEHNGIEQILEIACGLSPRGTLLKKQYGEKLLYIEADLPAMAARKRRLLQKEGLLGDQHQVVDCDILAKEGNVTLEAIFANKLDASKKTLVITEGLVNYFPLELISGFWGRLATLLTQNTGGVYISDIYPLLKSHPQFRFLKRSKKLIEIVARGEVPFHFSSHEEMEQHFRTLGFDSFNIHVPENYKQSLSLPISQRAASIVRVIEGIV